MSPVGSKVDLPSVRRFEAAGFRAWPAQATFYDGTWSVRLTPDMKARRLNSINPLDRGDGERIDARIDALRERFADAGRQVAFRLSPLASPELVAHLDRTGWKTESPSLVMRADLGDMELGSTSSAGEVPVGEFGRVAIAMDNLDAAHAAGFEALIGRIRAKVGLFHIDIGGEPAANAICVCDGQVAGLFEVVTASRFRGHGLGRQIVEAAFGWARRQGASIGWLQVEADNMVALGLYRSLGFDMVYPYHYRIKPA
ncbi:GNAT family N-acetyltransferase [Aliihoeflea aestuarii]|uniref:GNAT family N-acetyltransferase n=1 Tax=Aliihoeflea aestuarii TaxID=453840 RepID=UPI0020963D3A|nr:GNAT family N-acetyltransferase [Aliihoeflea aestuarii]